MSAACTDPSGRRRCRLQSYRKVVVRCLRPDASVSRIAIVKPIRRVVQAAGLDPRKIVRHTLRHTAVTHLVQAGVDLPTVKRISGHKTLAMVERYAHQNGAHLEAAMDRLEDRLKIA